MYFSIKHFLNFKTEAFTNIFLDVEFNQERFYMTICIFPGTFNPIHEAHLRVANFALQNYGFEKIIFIPAYIPPHKEINSNLAKHRYKMVELATSKNPKFEVSDIEYQRKANSYSLITVKKIIEQYNIKGKLNFLIGTDAFEKIDSWYKADELKKIVHFIVFPRGTELTDKSGWDFELAPMKFFDVSSTDIRKNKNDNIKEVKEYIEQNGLYN